MTETYTIDPPAPSTISLVDRIAQMEQRFDGWVAAQVATVEAQDRLAEQLDEIARQLQPFPTYHEVLGGGSPLAHVRINITRNTKGYSFETTVSVDSDDLDAVRRETAHLLRDADAIARHEIAEREWLDANPTAIDLGARDAQQAMQNDIGPASWDPEASDSQNDGWKQ